VSLLLFDCQVCHSLSSATSPPLYTTGNWDPKTQESGYSLTMPTVALRVIAGYEQGERYFLPHCCAVPSEILQKQIFPYIEAELENIRRLVEEDKKDQPTAVCTLRLWLKLGVIILQDAAEIAVQYSSRKDHPLFRLPVFSSPEFLVSCRI
jgi:hypothetical protein